MSKRTRTESGILDRARIARAINAKINKRFPYSQYGRTYSKRGVPGSWSMDTYGASFKDATAAQRAARRAGGYVGRGGFWADFKKGFTDVMDVAGKAVPLVEAVTGRGLYQGRGLYDSNNLVKGVGASRPSIEFNSPNDESNTLILTNKEYIGDVFGPASSDFVNTSYDLNPGLVTNFPFLAQFAQNFEEYEFVQLVFEYHATVDASSTNNPNGNTGTVIMATNYNVSLPPFTDKEQMIQYHGGVSGRMTDNLVHGVECDPAKSAGAATKYVRSALPINQDLKTYDLGKFQIAFQNIPTAYQNQQVGELWCHYKIKLAKPRLYAALAGNVTEHRALLRDTDQGMLSGLGSALPIVNDIQEPFLDWSAVPSSEYLTSISNSTNLRLGFAQASVTQIYPDYVLSEFCTLLKVTFPASLTGVFEIQVSLNWKPQSQSNKPYAFSAIKIEGQQADLLESKGLLVSGNVSPYEDMYGMYDVSRSSTGTLTVTNGVAAPFCSYSRMWYDNVTQQVNDSALFAVAKVQVKAATSGVDNFCVIPLVIQNSMFLQHVNAVSLVMRECTPFAAISPTVAHAQYQNTSGVLVTTGPACDTV